MASAWGNSWGLSWGNSWGSLIPIVGSVLKRAVTIQGQQTETIQLQGAKPSVTLQGSKQQNSITLNGSLD